MQRNEDQQKKTKKLKEIKHKKKGLFIYKKVPTTLSEIRLDNQPIDR